VKLVQQLLDARVAVEIDVGVRMAVARQELPHAERSRAVIRAEEDDVSDPVSDQLHPAKDEGPHDDLAKLAVGLHER
jgi:hypothetical protein